MEGTAAGAEVATCEEVVVTTEEVAAEATVTVAAAAREMARKLASRPHTTQGMTSRAGQFLEACPQAQARHNTRSPLLQLRAASWRMSMNYRSSSGRQCSQSSSAAVAKSKEGTQQQEGRLDPIVQSESHTTGTKKVCTSRVHFLSSQIKKRKNPKT